MSPYLDHIVILLPYSKLLALPSWLPSTFIISPGGTHSDLRTANKVISFYDGAYIELISFIDDLPSNRTGHRWGDCKFGIIDFALTHIDGDAVAYWRELDGRLRQRESEIRYERPIDGGRKREDGKEIKWNVTIAGEGVGTGEVPFFCHDVTERSLRVPGEEENLTHSSKAYGIKSLGIHVPKDRVPVLVESYEAILDARNISQDKGKGVFEIGRMRDIEGVKDGIRLVIESPEEFHGMRDQDGILLGGLVVGALGEEQKHPIRIDVPAEDGVGGMFLEFDVPVGKRSG